MLQVDYQPLSPEFPAWGRVAILPWDAEIFGFPVADYQLGDAHSISSDLQSFRKCFAAWTSEYRVELVSCFVPADQPHLRVLLPQLGFIFVDVTLQITFDLVNRAIPPVPVDFAMPSDQSDLERIAEHAFRFGRYHSDPVFPRALADRRYRHWIRNAISKISPDTAIYVVRRSGRVVAFTHVEIEGHRAHIALTAVDPGVQSQKVGQELASSRWSDLKQRGIREAYSRVSAVNAQVMTFVACQGHRFSLPLTIYHWHAPNAPHLLTGSRLFSHAWDEKTRD